MVVNFLFTAFYFFIGMFLALAAWFHLTRVPSQFLWLGAGAFLLIALWRLLHFSQG